MGVRIAAKPVTTNSAPTTSATSGKASGESFLEILMNGAGVGVQGAAPSNGEAQGQPDGESTEGGSNGGQNPESTASQTDLSEKAQIPVISGATKTAAAESTQAQGANAQTAASTAQAVSNQALLAKIDPALLVSTNGGGSQTETIVDAATTATQGKQPAATQGVRGKTSLAPQATANDKAPGQTLATVLITIPTPIPNETLILPSLTAVKGGSSPSSAGTTDDPTTSAVTAPEPKTASIDAANSSADGTTEDQGTAQPVVSSLLLDAKTPKALETALPLARDFAATALTAAAASNGKDAMSSAQQGATTDASQGTQGNINFSALLALSSTITSSTVTPMQNQFAQRASAATSSALHAHSGFSMEAATGSSQSSSAAGSSMSGSSSSSGDAQDSDGAAARTAQSGIDSIQHVPVSVASTAPIFAHSGDSAAGQVLTVAASAPAHLASSSKATAAASDAATPRSADAAMGADGGNAISSGGINTARLIQNMNDTEMRVGIHSAEFGDISIRTMVSQQQMQAQISVNHSELVNALSAHIPSVQAKIGNEYGLHAQIQVSQNGASFSNQNGQPSQRDQKPFVASTALDSMAAPAEMARLPLGVPAAAVLDGTRLDIRV